MILGGNFLVKIFSCTLVHIENFYAAKLSANNPNFDLKFCGRLDIV